METIDNILQELQNKRNITNQDILDIYDKIGKSKHHKYRDLVAIIPHTCTTDQLRGRMVTLKKTRQKLRGTELVEFLNRPFMVQPSATITLSSQPSTVSSTFQEIHGGVILEFTDKENAELKKSMKSVQKKLRFANLIKKSKARKIRSLETTLRSKRMAYIELKKRNVQMKIQLSNLKKQDDKTVPGRNMKVMRDKISNLQKSLSKLKNDKKELSQQYFSLKQNSDISEKLLMK